MASGSSSGSHTPTPAFHDDEQPNPLKAPSSKASQGNLLTVEFNRDRRASTQSTHSAASSVLSKDSGSAEGRLKRSPTSASIMRSPGMRKPSRAVVPESDDDDEVVEEEDTTFGSLRPTENKSCCGKLVARPKRALCLDHSAFFLISGDNPIRLFCFNLQRNKIFEGIVILNIIANCVFLALDDPTTEEDNEAYLNSAELYFTAVFTIEMLIKCIGMGFILHPGAYLRNAWNRIDFLIVVLSYVALDPRAGNYSALRTVRVLRPLRSMNQIRGLKIIVVGLLHSLTGLVHVLVLLLFAFAIFGILGVQLWKGLYRMRCVKFHPLAPNATNGTIPGETVTDIHCKNSTNTWNGWNGNTCPTGYECLPRHNPFNGYLHFDHLPAAVLILFTLITFEDWTAQLQILFDVYGQLAFIYFLLFLILGPYFISNLALAVINDKFVEAQDRALAEEEDEKEKRALEARMSVAAGMNLMTDSKEGPKSFELRQDTDTLELIQDGGSSEIGRSFMSADGQTLEQMEEEEEDDVELPPWRVKLEEIRDWVHVRTEGYARPTKGMTSEEIEYEQESAQTTYFSWFIVFCILINTVLLASQHHQQPDWLSDTQRIGNYVMAGIFGVEFLIKHFGMGFKHYWIEPFNFLDGCIVIITFIEIGLSGSGSVSVFRTLRLLRVMKLFKSFKSLRKIIRVMLSALKSTGYLNLIMLLYIFITALFGMQLFGGLYRRGETEDEPIRTTFDSFYWSIIAIFQILTRDNWIDLMIIGATETHWTAVFFFIFCVLIGDFLILNLFLAILIGAFEADNQREEDGDFDALGTSSQAGSSAGSASNLGTFRSKQSFFEGRIKPEDVIHIGAPMAKQMKRAQQLKRAKSIVGYKAPVVLRSSTSEGHLTAPGALNSNNSDKVPNMPSNRTSEEVQLVKQTIEDDVDFGETCGSVTFAIQEDSINTPQALNPNGTQPMVNFVQFDTSDHPFNNEEGDMMDDDDDDEPYEAMPYCTTCEADMERPLPPPPLIDRVPVADLHARMCHFVAVRHSKEKVINDLLTFIQKQIANKVPMTMEVLETIIGQAWACGLMLSNTMDEFVDAERPWTLLVEVLEEEQAILDLRVGEEQVGRCLIAYSTANVPVDHQTNGGDSLFIFGPTNPFRLILSEIVTNPWFEKTILTCICVSSILLAVDNPRDDQEAPLYRALYYIDVVFTSIFSLEMVMKIIAFNFLFHPTSYLRNPWNVLDMFVVAVSITSLAVVGIDIGFLKVFRTLRVLRTLRVISRNRGLKIVVMTLVESIKGITNVALISALNYLVFGILGIEFFSGKLYECNDPEIVYRVNCIGNFTDEESGDIVLRRWDPLPHNFNNLGEAALTLFEVSSMEWWVGVMYSGIDAVSYDRIGIRDNRPEFGLYFIIFIVISSFFLLNMFVGVVISNFNTVKNQMDGLSFLNEEQKLWVETQRLMLNFKPSVKMKPRNNPLSKWLQYCLSRNAFEAFIAACILLNVVVLGMDYEGSSETYDFALQTCNDIFSLIFLIEASLKIFTFGKLYFYDGWNRFDFFLVVVSIVGFIMRITIGGGGTGNIAALQVFRVFRILRVLRLVKQAKQVRILLESLWYSLPSLANIGLFLGLLFFMYAILGVQLFAFVNKGERIDNKQTNFHNFWHAILVLFKSMTVTDWNMFMHDCMVQEPECNSSGPDQNCGSPISPLYFISFLVIAAFVLTNLLVAIILDNFNTTMQLEKSSIRMADLHRFVEIWSDYDPDATMTMPTAKFPLLLARLRPPLGIPRSKSHLELLEQSQKYRLPEHGGFIHFVETLVPLARFSMDIHLKEREIREHEQQWRLNIQSIQDLPILRYRNSPVTVDQFFSATLIQAAYRRREAMKKVDEMRRVRQQTVQSYIDVQQRSLLSNSYQQHRNSGGNGHSLRRYSWSNDGTVAAGNGDHMPRNGSRRVSAAPMSTSVRRPSEAARSMPTRNSMDGTSPTSMERNDQQGATAQQIDAARRRSQTISVSHGGVPAKRTPSESTRRHSSDAAMSSSFSEGSLRK